MSDPTPQPSISHKRLSARTKVLISAAVLVAGVAAMIGLGANATYSGNDSAGGTFSGGTFSVSLGAGNSANNRLTVGASSVAPGDTIQRAVNITNNGDVAFGSVQLSTTAPVSSALDTDIVNGLQMSIEQCSLPWTESGPPYQYTCGGVSEIVVPERPVVGSGLDLGTGAVAPGGTGHYRITLSVPASGAAAIQGATSSIRYNFVAVQRAGGAQ